MLLPTLHTTATPFGQVPPKQAPILLFPCGHSFCTACIEAHVKHHKKSYCPICREPIQSKAVNFSLQQLIQNFVQQLGSNKHHGHVPPMHASTTGTSTDASATGWAGGAESALAATCDHSSDDMQETLAR